MAAQLWLGTATISALGYDRETRFTKQWSVSCQS
jgi:hypothetical protein